MYINLNDAAKSFFNILTGLGYSLSLYDAAGNDCLDSEKYRYAFIQQIGAMFSIISNQDDAYAAISYSSFNYNDKFEDLLLRLRTNAVKYGLGFRPISYEKKLQPRDFAFSAINNIKEEINMDMINEHGALHGASLKRSYKNVGDCRIIIHHNRPVSERRVGGRGLYIEKMFVENRDGERFAIKSKLLLGANALANHLNEGGDINDHVSKHILVLSEQYVDLRTVSRYIGANKKALKESVGSIKNAVDFKLNEMGNTFKRLTNPAVYSRVVSHIEPIALNETELDETHFNNILEQLNLDTDCEINSAIKTVARLISEQVINEARPLAIKGNGKGEEDHAGSYDGRDMSTLPDTSNKYGMNLPRDPNHPYADRTNYFVDEPGQSAEDARAEWDRRVDRDERQWNRALENPNHDDFKKIQTRLDQLGVSRKDFNHWAEKIRDAYWIVPAPDKGVKEDFREAAIQLLSGRIRRAKDIKTIKVPEQANFATRLAHLFHNVAFNVNNAVLANFCSRVSDDLIMAGKGIVPRQEKEEFFEVIAKIAEVTGIMKSGVANTAFINLLKKELYSGKYKNIDSNSKNQVSKVYAGVEYEQSRELREWASQFESTRVLLESTVSDLELNHVKQILEQISKKCNISDPKANVAQVVYNTVNEYCSRKEFNTYLLETRFYQVYKKGLVEFVLNQENPLLTESEVWDMSNTLINNCDSDETFATVTSKLTAAQLEQIINALSCNWKIEIAKPAITKLEAVKTQALTDLSLATDYKKTEIQQDFEDQVTV